jgi:hypothetical protein
MQEEIVMTVACRCLIQCCWRGGQWLVAGAIDLVAWLYAAMLACFPAWSRVPIVVQCGDRAARHTTRAILRHALRDSQRALGGLPVLSLRVRVLASAGTPPNFADLGQVLASVTVRALPDSPRAVITLAAMTADQRLTADQLIVALSAALDWLDDWQPGSGSTWTLPARTASPPARLAHDLLRWPATRPPAVMPPPSSPPTAQPPRGPVTEATPDDPLGLAGA